MIESYFFVPGNHPRLEHKLNTIKADHLIVDLEDAVLSTDIFEAVKSLNSIFSKENIWVRLILFEGFSLKLDLLRDLINKGFKKFIIPKIRNVKQLIQIENSLTNEIIKELNFILLVENPECLLSLPMLITETNLNIIGTGFGSQDYCTESGMKHHFDYLKVPRFQIMNTAKALGVKSIDTASMDSVAGESFQNELQEAFDMGFDGKFLIHPKQLKVLNNFPFIKEETIEEAFQVLDEYERLNKPAVFVYKNRAIEPPHIKNYRKIIEWSKKYGKK